MRFSMSHSTALRAKRWFTSDQAFSSYCALVRMLVDTPRYHPTHGIIQHTASSNTWHHPTHGIIQHMASSNVSSKAQARHVHRTAYRAYIAMLYRLTLVSSEQVELEARCVARRRPDTVHDTCTSGVRLELGSTSLSLFRGNLGFFGGNSPQPRGRPLYR